MEIRELKYFLAVAREGNISKAAEHLYITQPTLSRQLKNLEEEIGTPLFARGSRKITLTDAGILLRKRADELVSLYEKTQKEMKTSSDAVSGDVYIGGGESYAVETVARAAKQLHDNHPDVFFHFYSADTNTVAERLDKGLIDFGILIEPCDLTKYEFVRLPLTDTWGLLMRTDNPLATKKQITPADLENEPLLFSRHSLGTNPVDEWFGRTSTSLNVTATYNLIYNASLLVKAGLGSAVCLDKLVNTTKESGLVFVPFYPRLVSNLDIAWKKYQVFSKASELFLEALQAEIDE